MNAELEAAIALAQEKEELKGQVIDVPSERAGKRGPHVTIQQSDSWGTVTSAVEFMQYGGGVAWSVKVNIFNGDQDDGLTRAQALIAAAQDITGRLRGWNPSDEDSPKKKR